MKLELMELMLISLASLALSRFRCVIISFMLELLVAMVVLWVAG